MIGGSQILSVEQEVGGSSPPNCTSAFEPERAPTLPARLTKRCAAGFGKRGFGLSRVNGSNNGR
jgi:hypothetical protein